MIEYIKRKISKINNDSASRVFDAESYPIYYSQNGVLIREEKDGSKYEVTINGGKEQILRKL